MTSAAEKKRQTMAEALSAQIRALMPQAQAGDQVGEEEKDEPGEARKKTDRVEHGGTGLSRVEQGQAESGNLEQSRAVQGSPGLPWTAHTDTVGQTRADQDCPKEQGSESRVEQPPPTHKPSRVEQSGTATKPDRVEQGKKPQKKRKPTPRQRSLYIFLKANQYVETTYNELVQATGIPYGTLRKALDKLTEEGIIEAHTVEGVGIEVQFLSPHDGYEYNGQGRALLTTAKPSRVEQGEAGSKPDRVEQGGAEETPYNERARVRERKKEILNSFFWDNEQIKEEWPLLYRVGVNAEVLQRGRQQRLDLHGEDLDRKTVAEGLTALEWELGQKEKLHFHSGQHKGKEVEARPLVISSLKNFGFIIPHPDYVSPEEEALAIKKALLEKRRAARKEAERLDALIWWEEQPEEVREAVKRRCGSFAKKEEDQAVFGFKKRAEFEVKQS